MSGGVVAIVRMDGWTIEAEAIALDSRTWNGWQRPTFERATALRIVEAMNEQARAEGLDWALVVDGDQVAEISEGEQLDRFDLATLGAGAWSWEVAR